MARRKKPKTVPLELPVPFRTASPSFTTTDELVEILSFVDELHDATARADGQFYANLLADDLVIAEPSAPHVAEDVATAIAVGIAVHRIAATHAELTTAADEVHTFVSHLIAWAAMEQAIDLPERHGPWVTWATTLGYVIARRGDSALRATRAAFAEWMAACPPMTHSAYFDQRLVLDIGPGPNNSIYARNYLPLRPAGIERAHDVVLFNTACDDFTERVIGTRVNSTRRMRNVFHITWKSLAPRSGSALTAVTR